MYARPETEVPPESLWYVGSRGDRKGYGRFVELVMHSRRWGPGGGLGSLGAEERKVTESLS